MDHPKITIMGVGGIGGLIAALLLKAYGENVSLVARGERKKALLSGGISLESDCFGNFVQPVFQINEDPSTFGVQDIVLICVKNAALRSAARQLLPVIGPETVVMPVMNGVNVGKILREELPQCRLLESVIYTVASVTPEQHIRQQGNFTSIQLGDPAGSEAGARAAELIAGVLSGAGIDNRIMPDVRAAVWNKFIFNCAYNVITARHGILIGSVKADPVLLGEYRFLMEEALAVSRAEGVNLPDTLIDKHMVRLDHTGDDSDSSLGRDFRAGRAGEMDVFCGEVVRMAESYGISVPVTAKYYDALKTIAAGFAR